MAILGQAKVGTMRLNAARLDFYRPLCYLTLAGTRCETQVRKDSVRVEKFNSSTAEAQGQLNRMTFRMGAGTVTPTGFMEVKFSSGSTAPSSLKFGGHIQKVTQTIEGKAANAAFDVIAVGYGWLFNRLYVNKAYTAVSATAVILDLVATFTTGTTTVHVETGLPPISINFSNVLPMDALGQIAALVGTITGDGARFFIDDTNDLWFYTVERRASPDTIIGLNPTNPIAEVESITVSHDQSQRRTRVFVKGGAQSTTSGAVQAGATVIPLTNAQPFDLGLRGLASGQVVVETPLSHLPASSTQTTRADVITYTGTSRSGIVAAPTAAMVAGCQVTSYTTGGALTVNKAYRWAFTYVTANGETAISPFMDGFMPSVDTRAILDLTGLYVIGPGGGHVPPDSSITAINIYRTVANGTQLFFDQQVVCGTLDWPTSQNDDVADGALGTSAPSGTTPCYRGQTSTTSSTGASPGATSIPSVQNVTFFDAAGGYAVIGEIVIQYTGVTYSGAGGNTIGGTVLLAAPLQSTVVASEAIKPTPALTGCTASVALAPTPPVPEGLNGVAPGLTIGTLYNWATTFVTAAGESTPSALSGTYAKAAPGALAAPTLANGGTGTGPTNTGVYSYKFGIRTNQGMLTPISTVSANITSNGTGILVTLPILTPSGTVSLFRTKAGGSTYFLCPTVSGISSPFIDNSTDASLTTLVTDNWTQKYTLNAIPIGPSGVTSRKVYRNTGSGTTLKLVTTLADNTTTTADDTVADGSLGASAPSTDTAGVVGLPLIASGQTVTAFAVKNDTTQQGIVGIFEKYVTDTSLLTVDGPDAEATGQLAINSTADDQVSVASRDAKIQPGVLLPVNIGAPNNMSGTFMVQDVTITQFEAKTNGVPYLYPLIEAHGGSQRVVLEDFLWATKLAVDALQ